MIGDLTHLQLKENCSRKVVFNYIVVGKKNFNYTNSVSSKLFLWS